MGAGTASALTHWRHDCFLMKAFLSWTPAQGHRKESKNSSSVLFGVTVRGDTPTSTARLLDPRMWAVEGWPYIPPCGSRHTPQSGPQGSGCWLSSSTITSLLQTILLFSEASSFGVSGNMVSPGNFMGMGCLSAVLPSPENETFSLRQCCLSCHGDG